MPGRPLRSTTYTRRWFDFWGRGICNVKNYLKKPIPNRVFFVGACRMGMTAINSSNLKTSRSCAGASITGYLPPRNASIREFAIISSNEPHLLTQAILRTQQRIPLSTKLMPLVVRLRLDKAIAIHRSWKHPDPKHPER